MYIKALAAQQGYKTLTVVCLNIKTWNNQRNVKNLEKVYFFTYQKETNIILLRVISQVAYSIT